MYTTYSLQNTSGVLTSADWEYSNFGIPMISCVPKNDIDECYVCLADISGLNMKKCKSVTYLSLRTTISPVPHYNENADSCLQMFYVHWNWIIGRWWCECFHRHGREWQCFWGTIIWNDTVWWRRVEHLIIISKLK